MKLALAATVVVALLVTGCGSGNQSGAPSDSTLQKRVQELETQIQDREKDVSAVSLERDRLTRQLDELAAMRRRLENLVKEKEARVGELEEALEQASSDTETKAGPSAAAAEEPGRIEALGAKAVAEFKLGQLNARLSAVTKEMEAKTAQLETVRKSAEEKAARLDRLTAETQQLRASEQARTQELSEKVAQLQEDLSKRISDEANLKRELDEKTAMLGALRQAVVDAGRIKTSAEKETVETQKGAEKLSKELEIAKSHLAGLNEELESCRVNFDSREAELNRLNSELRAAFMREQALYADVDRFRHESQALQSRPASVAPQESAARKESEPTSLDRILGASGQKEVGASLY